MPILFQGAGQMTPAQQYTLRKAAGNTPRPGRKPRKAKKKRNAVKAAVRSAAKRTVKRVAKRAGKAILKKGSKAAKDYMAKIRRMRKK